MRLNFTHWAFKRTNVPVPVYKHERGTDLWTKVSLPILQTSDDICLGSTFNHWACFGLTCHRLSTIKLAGGKLVDAEQHGIVEVSLMVHKSVGLALNALFPLFCYWLPWLQKFTLWTSRSKQKCGARVAGLVHCGSDCDVSTQDGWFSVILLQMCFKGSSFIRINTVNWFFILTSCKHWLNAIWIVGWSNK